MSVPDVKLPKAPTLAWESSASVAGLVMTLAVAAVLVVSGPALVNRYFDHLEYKMCIEAGGNTNGHGSCGGVGVKK